MSIYLFEFEGVTYFALLEVLPEGQENDEVLIMHAATVSNTSFRFFPRVFVSFRNLAAPTDESLSSQNTISPSYIVLSASANSYK